MANKKNNISKDIKYFYKKYILMPFLDLSKSKPNDNRFTKIRINNGEVLNHGYQDTNNKHKSSIVEFFKPAKKELWIGEFRSFLIMLSFVLLFTCILIGGVDFINDIKHLQLNTVYAESMINGGINDIQNANIKNAKNKFYLAFSSLYDISNKTSFITNLSIGVYGKLINFSSNDLNEVVRSFDNISTSLIKMISDIEKFNDKNNLYKINEVKNAFANIDLNLQIINSTLDKINITFLPKQYQNEIIKYKEKINDLSNMSHNIYLGSNIISYIIGGDNSSKRMLFIFENANELRATGGFMGSYALVDFKDGNIVNYEVPGGGIYDLRAGFTKTLEPPEPFKILVSKWEIQDANWFFDFKKSANKIIDFFEPSSGTSVDGIIVINSNMMSSLMDLVGDIKLDNYDITLTKYNIIDELQNIIGSQRNKTNKPKLVIGGLFEKISDAILNKKDFELEKIYNLFDDVKNKKQILAYIKDDYVQNYVRNLGISGEIADVNNNEDYLAVVDTNIGGGKTSQYIDRSVDQTVDILGNGDIIKTLIINKKYLRQNNNFDTKNIEFLRVYVPEGSELISISGFDNVKIDSKIYANYDIDKDLINLNSLSVRDFNTNTIIYNDEGKTIFGNFIYLNPGENKQVIVKYKLPFRASFDNEGNFKYMLYFQKQPGVDNLKYSITINNVSDDNGILDRDKQIINNIKK